MILLMTGRRAAGMGKRGIFGRKKDKIPPSRRKDTIRSIYHTTECGKRQFVFHNHVEKNRRRQAEVFSKKAKQTVERSKCPFPEPK
jgi:hypothetical protein